jgi:hypothetical protein
LIPGNLDTLNSGLRALAGLYDVDMDWVSRASKFSGLEPSKEFQYEDQICKLSNAKKEEFLKRILRDEAHLKIKLVNELDLLLGNKKKEEKSGEKITLRDLLDE